MEVILGQFHDFIEDRDPMRFWDGEFDSELVDFLFNEIADLSAYRKDNGGWCNKHPEYRFQFVHYIRLLCKSIILPELQLEFFGQTYTIPDHEVQSIAAVYHSGIFYEEEVYYWQEIYDSEVNKVNRKLLKSVQNYFTSNVLDEGEELDTFIISSIEKYLSIRLYSTDYESLLFTRDGMFTHLFNVEMGYRIALDLINDFIREKLSLANWKTVLCWDNTLLIDQLRSAVEHGSNILNMTGRKDSHKLNGRWELSTGSIKDSVGIFLARKAVVTFLSKDTDVDIRKEISECITYVENPRQVQYHTKLECLSITSFLEYLLDSSQSLYGPKYSLNKLDFCLQRIASSNKEPVFLGKMFQHIYDGSNKSQDERFLQLEKSVKGKLFLNAIQFLQQTLEKKEPEHAIGIVSRKGRNTYQYRKKLHLSIHNLIGQDGNIVAINKGPPIQKYFVFQVSKSTHYERILQGIANDVGIVPTILVESKSILKVQFCLLLFTEYLLQFSRVCKNSRIEIHDDDENGLEFLIRRIKWSLERSITLLEIQQCSEDSSYLQVLFRLLDDVLQDISKKNTISISNEIQQGLRNVICGFKYYDYEYFGRDFFIPKLVFGTSLVDFDNPEWIRFS